MLPPSLAPGTVVSEPTAEDRVDVTITAFDSQQRIEDCPFVTRGGVPPGIGDSCWVAFDLTGRAVVVAFDPA